MARFVLLSILSLVVLAGCAGTTEPEPTPPPPVVRPAPPPPPPRAPEPEPVRVVQPVELPKTASGRPALAATGLVALAGAGFLGWLRRRG